jgi:hypothetical protein
MALLVRHPLAQILPLAAITFAILATMGTTYLVEVPRLFRCISLAQKSMRQAALAPAPRPG